MRERISYEFKSRNLFTQTLTHSFHADEHCLDHSRCNERLELLGDAILEIVTSEFLCRKYEVLPKGDLTRTGASIVCELTLAYRTGDIELGQYLYLDKDEGATNGRDHNSVVSGAMKALIDVIYLDGGLVNVKGFIHHFILNDIEHKQLFYDSEVTLQGMVQSRQEASLSYEIAREEGPDHSKSFKVCAKIGDEGAGQGAGRTKKVAEQMAAYNDILKPKAQEAATEGQADGLCT